MGAYDDIINFPHHVSKKHPKMAISDRAAQFSPFAALTGYSDEIKEAARLTDEKIELSEEQRIELSDRLRLLEDTLPQQPEVLLTYFLPDVRKNGGNYITVAGKLKRLDRVHRSILLTNGVIIPFDDLLWVKCME